MPVGAAPYIPVGGLSMLNPVSPSGQVDTAIAQLAASQEQMGQAQKLYHQQQLQAMFDKARDFYLAGTGQVDTSKMPKEIALGGKGAREKWMREQRAKLGSGSLSGTSGFGAGGSGLEKAFEMFGIKPGTDASIDAILKYGPEGAIAADYDLQKKREAEQRQNRQLALDDISSDRASYLDRPERKESRGLMMEVLKNPEVLSDEVQRRMMGEQLDIADAGRQAGQDELREVTGGRGGAYVSGMGRLRDEGLSNVASESNRVRVQAALANRDSTLDAIRASTDLTTNDEGHIGNYRGERRRTLNADIRLPDFGSLAQFLAAQRGQGGGLGAGQGGLPTFGPLDPIAGQLQAATAGLAGEFGDPISFLGGGDNGPQKTTTLSAYSPTSAYSGDSSGYSGWKKKKKKTYWQPQGGAQAGASASVPPPPGSASVTPSSYAAGGATASPQPAAIDMPPVPYAAPAGYGPTYGQYGIESMFQGSNPAFYAAPAGVSPTMPSGSTSGASPMPIIPPPSSSPASIPFMSGPTGTITGGHVVGPPDAPRPSIIGGLSGHGSGYWEP